MRLFERGDETDLASSFKRYAKRLRRAKKSDRDHGRAVRPLETQLEMVLLLAKLLDRIDLGIFKKEKRLRIAFAKRRKLLNVSVCLPTDIIEDHFPIKQGRLFERHDAHT